MVLIFLSPNAYVHVVVLVLPFDHNNFFIICIDIAVVFPKPVVLFPSFFFYGVLLFADLF